MGNLLTYQLINLSTIFFNTLLEALQATTTLEWFAFAFSVIYVVLAAQRNIWCWLFGLISVSLYAYLFFSIKLYSDASLQVFYIGMSVYGWWSWRQEGNTGADKLEGIKTWPLKFHYWAIILGFVFVAAWGTLMNYASADLPYIDAFTTAFAIVPTYMVAKKILENWLYFIVIDLVCIAVYWYKEIYLTALLFGIFSVIAVVGYWKWRRVVHSS